MRVGDRPEGSQTSSRDGDGQPERDARRPLVSWRAALVVIAIGLVVLLGGGTVVVRQLRATESQQLAAVPPTVPASAPTTESRPAPTAVSGATAAPNSSAPGVAPTAVGTTAAQPAVATAPTPVPATSVAAASNDQQPEDEVAAAYLNYWDVTTNAFWNLDPSKLDEVATGEELAQLGSDIERLRGEGRAIKTEVQHDFSVIQFDGNEAQVFDRYRDFSIYVDPNTKQALAGEIRPTTPENAPLNSILYHLRKDGGKWKVADGERYANN